MPTTTAHHIRNLEIRRDMEAVFAIDRAGPPPHWQTKTFLDFIRSRLVIGLVAECDGAVAGYALYSVSTTCLGILELAVAAQFRRQGIGSALVRNLTRKAAARALPLEAIVREANLPAQLFLRAAGFRAYRIVPRFWDGCEDGYLFRL